jgi:hypothetical protein
LVATTPLRASTQAEAMAEVRKDLGRADVTCMDLRIVFMGSSYLGNEKTIKIEKKQRLVEKKIKKMNWIKQRIGIASPAAEWCAS